MDDYRDNKIEDRDKYSYYTEKYRKMNISDFNIVVQRDLQNLKDRTQCGRNDSERLAVINGTISRLKELIYLLGTNKVPDRGESYPPNYVLEDTATYEAILDNSNLIHPELKNDITYEELKEALYNDGVTDAENIVERKKLMDEYEFSSIERERVSLLSNPGKLFQDRNLLFESAFKQVLAERNDNK